MARGEDTGHHPARKVGRPAGEFLPPTISNLEHRALTQQEYYAIADRSARPPTGTDPMMVSDIHRGYPWGPHGVTGRVRPHT